MNGKETLTMHEVRAAVNSKEIQKKANGSKDNADGDLLLVRGRTKEKGSRGQHGRSQRRSLLRCDMKMKTPPP